MKEKRKRQAYQPDWLPPVGQKYERPPRKLGCLQSIILVVILSVVGLGCVLLLNLLAAFAIVYAA